MPELTGVSINDVSNLFSNAPPRPEVRDEDGDNASLEAIQEEGGPSSRDATPISVR